jgi:hypothetical protein
MNSKDKGKRGERMWVSVLKFFGFDAKRTGFHQSQQGHDAPDVTCHDLPVHWEVKNTEKALLRDWLAQAQGDAKPYQIPCVVWKRNHGKWIAILQAEHLLTIFQCCDVKALEEQIQTKKKVEK